MLPQVPLRLGRAKPVEQANSQAEPACEFDRVGQAPGAIRVKKTGGPGINRLTSKIVRPGIGQIKLDIEVGRRDGNQRHGKRWVGGMTVTFQCSMLAGMTL